MTMIQILQFWPFFDFWNFDLLMFGSGFIFRKLEKELSGGKPIFWRPLVCLSALVSLR